MLPLLTEYSDAIAIGYYNTLTDLEAVLNSNNNPYAVAGAFGCVFKVQTPAGKQMAIKCFTIHVDNKQTRLEAIGTYLDQHPNPYTLHYRYLPNEVWVGGADPATYYSILIMDWIAGKTLGEAVREAVQNNQTDYLQQIANNFANMALWLLSQPIAHGDLKHDNILVKPNGSLVLIDYDGMYVPALKNYPAENIGVAEYQHPQRQLSDFNQHIDDFSIAVIATALYGIAQSPQLYTQYGNPDTLLFKRPDFEKTRSPLWRALNALNHPLIAPLLDQLQTALQTNSLQLPNLSQTLQTQALQPLPNNIPAVEALIVQKETELLRIKEHLKHLQTTALPPDTYTENALGIGLVMQRIQGGTFLMGSPKSEANRGLDEQQHRVTLSDFYIGAYQVTQAQWVAVMGNNPSLFKGDNLPVVSVSWDDIQVFLQKLNAKSRPLGGKRGYYRLPTEAEWEYAARGGTNTPFYTGNCLSTDQANYDGNRPYQNCAKGQYRGKTTPVGSFAPNPYGLYDMHGNVLEWCNDWYNANYYQSSPANNPTGPTTGSYRVLHGGSWINNARHCRVADRTGNAPGFRDDHIGFRLVFVP